MKTHFFLWLAAILVISQIATNSTKAQIVVDDVIISEFFDDILRVNNGSVTDLFDIDTLARTELDLLATSVSATPELFEFTFEASVFARSTVTQTIYLFNYDSGQFEQVDSRPARRFTDQVVVVTPFGDLSRFVEPGTNSVEARIRFQSASQRQQFSSNIDHARWTIR